MALGLTQAQLAERLGQSQHYVSRYELGDRRLDVFELDAICLALDTALEDVWALLRPLMAQKRALGSPSPSSSKPRSRASIRRRPAPAPLEDGTTGIGADAGRRVKRARALLQNAGDDAPSIEEVASSVGWSADHLRQMFRAVLGASPHQVSASARLGRARALLLEDALPVARVAALCGFANASHFAQAFKREFGLSPRQLRATRGSGDARIEAPDASCG